MFTGLVEETGVTKRIKESGDSIRLAVLARVCGVGTKVGNSIAVNGCCLTVVRMSTENRGKVLEFDLLRETWKRTNFHTLVPGAAVNLERSLKAEDRLGGHFVTGHIDGTGVIKCWEQVGSDWLLEVQPPTELMRYMVSKGTVALDGISLTVASVMAKTFRIWIIPHTYQVTALRERRVGDQVNLEGDILGKYVEKLLAGRTTAPARRRQ